MRMTLVLLVLLPLGLAGCSRGIPGVTHELKASHYQGVGGIKLSPDGQRCVYCTESLDRREAVGLAAFPDGGIPMIENCTYEVYIYDLVNRGSPKRVGSWSRRESDKFTLWFFNGRDAVLAKDDGQKRSFQRVDTVTGKRQEVAQADEPAIASEHDRLEPNLSAWQELRTKHVEYEDGEFLLWDPSKREFEHLFEMPRVVGKDALQPYWTQERERKRRAYAIHQAWDCTARNHGDSVYVTLETYVPRPGQAARVYRFWYTLGIPAKLEEQVYGYRDSLLTVVDRELGPRGTQVTQAFSMKTLSRIYGPQGRLYGANPIHTSIEVRFAPSPLPQDQGAGYPGIYDGDYGQTGVEFRFR